MTARSALFIAIVLLSSSLLIIFPVPTGALSFSKGAPLATANASYVSENMGDRLGSSVAMVGDVNGDGYGDMLMGAPTNGEPSSNAGQVYLILGKPTGWANGVGIANAAASFWGENPNDHAGESVAGVGDVNGDGYDDFIIGAPYNDFASSDAGQVYLFFGRPTGWAMDTSLSQANASFLGEAGGDGAGNSVAGVGDVNGDGYDDILIAASGNDEGGVPNGNAGQVYLILGRASNWVLQRSLTLANASFLGDQTLGHLGEAIAYAGDVNGDGYSDLMIGSIYGTGARGKVYLVLGRPSGWKNDVRLDSSNDGSFLGEADGDQLTTSLACAGDVNDDGYDDILVGAPNKFIDGNLQGKTYLIWGRASGWPSNDSIANGTASFKGEVQGDLAGSMVAGAGDVNGDGFDDFMISAKKNDGSAFDAGKVYLFLGNASTGFGQNASINTSEASFLGEATENWVGDRLAGGNDLDRDGYDDIVIGVRYYPNSGNWAGKVYVLFPDRNKQPSAVTSVLFSASAGSGVPISSARIFDTVHVTLTGTDSDPATSNVALVNVTSSLGPHNSFTMKLREGGPSTGLFSAPLRLGEWTNPGTGTLGVRPEGTVTIQSVMDPSRTATLTVDWALPKILPSMNLLNATEDTPFNVTYSVQGGKPPITWTLEGPPSWLAFDPVLVRLNGTPRNGDVGQGTVTLKVTDSAGKTSSLPINIVVSNVPPNMTTAPNLSAFEDLPYLLDLNSSDDGQGTVTWQLATNSTWLHINVSTGILNGTPGNDDVGDWYANVTVDDGNGGTDRLNFTINVTNTNDVPVIISTPKLEAEEFENYTYRVEVVDIDKGATLSYNLDIAPTGMTISTSGLVTWTPTSAQAGPNPVRVNVSDWSSWTLQDFNVTVIVHPPSALLLSPTNGTIVDTKTPELRWLVADPNSALVLNDIYLSEDENAVSAQELSALLATNVVQNKFPIAFALKKGATYYWTVVPNDGGNRGRCTSGIWSFTVNESLDNRAPTIKSVPPTSVVAGELFIYQVEASDLDVGDVLNYTLEQAPAGMVIDQRNGTITWTPGQSQVGDQMVIVRVSDRWAYDEQQFVVKVEAPVINHVPNIAAIADQTVEVGKNLSFRVSASDPDPGDRINFSLSVAPPGMTIDMTTGVLTWTPTDQQVGEHTVTVQVSDGKETVNQSFKVTVVEKQAAAGGGGAISPMVLALLAMVIIIVIGAVLYIAASGRKQRESQAKATEAMATEIAAVKAAITEEASSVDDFTIDGAFLIFRDGRLMVRTLEKGSDIDDQLFGSMLVAIQSFVSESFKADAGLDSFEFGGRHIVLVKGRFLFLVVSLTGKEPPTLRDEMRAVVEKVEGTYAGALETWDGDQRRFAGSEALVAPIFGLKETLKVRRVKGDVKVMSALEFYEGFVRLKVACVNKHDTTITDASLNLTYNSEALRFDRVEPELPHEGTNVRLGAIKPGEKKTVAYLLDPLICQESFVDCTLTYLDFKGVLQHADMKRRPVDIVCPIFYTPQTVNVAMLKRLLGELSYKDSRIFKIDDLDILKKAYGLAKDVVSGHDVKMVREFTEPMPFQAESWYYGEISTGDENLVIRVAVRESGQYLEMFVASKNLAALTGLLAEITKKVREKVEQFGARGTTVEFHVDKALKAQIESTTSLLDKYAETEMPPRDTEQR